MTPAKAWRRLVPLEIPVEPGMISDKSTDAGGYAWGLDVHGVLYLTYRHDWPSRSANRPRLSVFDPQWSVYHGLRYIEWVS